MNYVNINGQRINLSNILGYSSIGEMVHFDLLLPHADYERECLPNDNIQIEFETEEEANQCIKFLDNKTKCEVFKLAVPE